MEWKQRLPLLYLKKKNMKSNGKDKVDMKKTFLGYVCWNEDVRRSLAFVVRNTPGVTGFVGSHGAGSKPAPLLTMKLAKFTSIRHEHTSFDVEFSGRIC